jgi:hypothetical protein
MSSFAHRPPPVQPETDAEARAAWEQWASTPAGRLELIRHRLAEIQREVGDLLAALTVGESVDLGGDFVPSDGPESGCDLRDCGPAPF